MMHINLQNRPFLDEVIDRVSRMVSDWDSSNRHIVNENNNLSLPLSLLFNIIYCLYIYTRNPTKHIKYKKNK